MGLDDEAFEKLQRTRAAEDTLDDFNAELSGTKAGYQYRTSAVDHESRPDIRAKKARKAEAKLSALEALLATDPEYRALYEDTRNKINDAGAWAEAALAEAEAVLEQAEQELDELEDSAARTPDGRLAFKGPDGKVYDQDGDAIEGVQADSIVWPEGVPTYEEYLAKKQAVAEARERVDVWQQYLLLIGEARDRLNDPDNPPSTEELEDIQKRIQDEMPTEVSNPSTEPEPDDVQTSFAPGGLPKV